jgi:hypothetical protein
VVRVNPQSIGLVMLPVLLYASAKEISARELRVLWRPVAGIVLGLVLANSRRDTAGEARRANTRSGYPSGRTTLLTVTLAW